MEKCSSWNNDQKNKMKHITPRSQLSFLFSYITFSLKTEFKLSKHKFIWNCIKSNFKPIKKEMCTKPISKSLFIDFFFFFLVLLAQMASDNFSMFFQFLNINELLVPWLNPMAKLRRPITYWWRTNYPV